MCNVEKIGVLSIIQDLGIENIDWDNCDHFGLISRIDFISGHYLNQLNDISKETNRPCKIELLKLKRYGITNFAFNTAIRVMTDRNLKVTPSQAEKLIMIINKYRFRTYYAATLGFTNTDRDTFNMKVPLDQPVVMSHITKNVDAIIWKWDFSTLNLSETIRFLRYAKLRRCISQSIMESFLLYLYQYRVKTTSDVKQLLKSQAVLKTMRCKHSLATKMLWIVCGKLFRCDKPPIDYSNDPDVLLVSRDLFYNDELNSLNIGDDDFCAHHWAKVFRSCYNDPERKKFVIEYFAIELSYEQENID